MNGAGVLTFGQHNGALTFFVDSVVILKADKHVIANLLSEIGVAVRGDTSSSANRSGNDKATG